ncbi:MAG: hypothetical protein J6113_01785, partial [Lachnospiraceae bacterium]|nr:hypothetical protein [Lachnospiraceae bacterium]
RGCTGKTEKSEDLPVCLDKRNAGMHWQNGEKRGFASVSGQAQCGDALAKWRKARICQCTPEKETKRDTGKTMKSEDLPVHPAKAGKR